MLYIVLGLLSFLDFVAWLGRLLLVSLFIFVLPQGASLYMSSVL